MSEATMTLNDDQLEQIGRYVQKNLPEWLRTLPPQTVQITDPVLLERTVRVEEELKAQRELMIERFDAVDKRFEEQLAHSNARFEAVDRRFEDQLAHSNARFEAMDKRFETADKRFEDMNSRFDDLNKRLTHAEWLLGILVTTFMALNTAIQVLL